MGTDTERQRVEVVAEGLFRTYHDFGEGDICVTVAVALEEITGAAAGEVVAEFSRYADPEAVNQIFRPHPNGPARTGVGYIVLHIAGYKITIQSDGEIRLKESSP